MNASAFRVVVIASSAGGVDALSRILSQLPSFPVAIAIVQHRSARYPSRLAHILQRHTGLEVKEASHGEAIAAGTVYLAPPGVHLVIDGDQTARLLTGAKVKHVRPCADLLFASAAKVFGKRLIGVVLTGVDGDGSEGIQCIKDRGGTVIAQDEGTSQFFSMPRTAIETGSVDFVLPLDLIAPALFALARTKARVDEQIAS